MPTVVCQNPACGKEFVVAPYRIKEGSGKYCSIPCRHIPVMVLCENPACRQPFMRERKSYKKKYCSDLCRTGERYIVICRNPECLKKFSVNPARFKRTKKFHCSRQCQQRYSVLFPPPKKPVTHMRCKDCGVTKPIAEFYKNPGTPTERQPHCKPCYQARGATYYKHHRDERRTYTRNYRARKLQATRIERVSLRVIFRRDRGICSLCHTKVKRQDASVDHVIPLSLGGNDTYQHCVLAHRRCNAGKQNRTVPQQQRLFG